MPELLDYAKPSPKGLPLWAHALMGIAVVAAALATLLLVGRLLRWILRYLWDGSIAG